MKTGLGLKLVTGLGRGVPLGFSGQQVELRVQGNVRTLVHQGDSVLDLRVNTDGTMAMEVRLCGSTSVMRRWLLNDVLAAMDVAERLWLKAPGGPVVCGRHGRCWAGPPLEAGLWGAFRFEQRWNVYVQSVVWKLVGVVP